MLLWQAVDQGMLSLERLERTQTMFRPPIYLFKLILLIGILLFLLQAVANFVRYIYIAHTGKAVGNGT